MNEEKKYLVLGSHQMRMCHPETCCCETDYVLTEKVKSSEFPYNSFRRIVTNVYTPEEGNNLIKKLEKSEIEN